MEVKISRWHIDPGVRGKHSGLSYCEACDYVPYRKAEFNSRSLEHTRGNQILSPYCPNCGARMENGISK